MKTENVLIAAVIISGALFAYYIYAKNSSQLRIGANGVTGSLNINQLVGDASSLIGAIGNAYSGSSGGSGDASYTDVLDATASDYGYSN